MSKLEEAPGRDLKILAAETLACAMCWEPQVRIVGNVTALEMARLARFVLDHCPLPGLLLCPSCCKSCETLPPHPPTMHSSHEWWEEGEYATCQCGAEVIVDVDDGIASLELRGVE